MKDRVVFRKWTNGDVIALLPDNKELWLDVIALLPDNEASPGRIDMYEHIRQHGEGSLEVIAETTLASPSEYQPLLEELTTIGYDLRVMKRLTKTKANRGINDA